MDKQAKLASIESEVHKLFFFDEHKDEIPAVTHTAVNMYVCQDLAGFKLSL